jgi:hypothetical protein
MNIDRKITYFCQLSPVFWEGLRHVCRPECRKQKETVFNAPKKQKMKKIEKTEKIGEKKLHPSSTCCPE